MSKFILTLVGGALAFGSTWAIASDMAASQKEAQLSKMMSVGNANAPARGQAIAKSGMTADEPVLTGAAVHEQTLDKTIASGNANAPARGKAITRSGEVSRG